MIRPFLIAVQFLTVLPIRLKRPPTETETGRSLTFYPLIGLLLGAALAIGGWLLRHQNPMLDAALLLAAWTAGTGALHLDGLADCADAWVGGRGDRARTLAIMKDPYSGPMGVTVIAIILIVKFAALVVLCERHAFEALSLPPLFGRAAIQFLFLTTPYVRETGLGAPFVRYMRRNEMRIALALVALATSLLVGWKGLIALAVAVVILLLVRKTALARIGGATGDAIGALVEVTEAGALLVFCFVVY